MQKLRAGMGYGMHADCLRVGKSSLLNSLLDYENLACAVSFKIPDHYLPERGGQWGS